MTMYRQHTIWTSKLLLFTAVAVAAFAIAQPAHAYELSFAEALGGYINADPNQGITFQGYSFGCFNQVAALTRDLNSQGTYYSAGTPAGYLQRRLYSSSGGFGGGTVVPFPPSPPPPIAFTEFITTSFVSGTGGSGSGSGSSGGPGNTFTATGHLQAVPTLIRSGDISHVYWNVKNVSSCTVVGSNNDGTLGSGTGIWNTLFSGSSGKTTSPITSQTTYTLHCTALDGASPPTIDESVTVNVTPIFQEL